MASSSLNPLSRPIFAYWDDSIVMNSIRYCFSLIGFCTNILLIWIIFSTNLRLHQCNWYMALLAIADLAIAIGLFIRATYQIYASSIGIIFYSRWICVLVNTLMGIGLTMTRIAVIALAADRLYMVIHPLTYKSKLNKSLFAIVFSIDLMFASIDAFFKFYDVDDSNSILLCSMGSASGPLSAIFGQFYSNICLALLFVLYVPFLAIYRRKCSHSGLISSWNWRRQLEVTGTTIWLLFFYSFLWGGSFSSLLFVNLFTENGKFYAGYITYIFGFLSSACSSASFFIYLRKHPGIQKQTRILLARIFFRNGQQQNLDNKVFSISAQNTAKNVQHGDGVKMANIHKA